MSAARSSSVGATAREIPSDSHVLSCYSYEAGVVRSCSLGGRPEGSGLGAAGKGDGAGV